MNEIRNGERKEKRGKGMRERKGRKEGMRERKIRRRERETDE